MIYVKLLYDLFTISFLNEIILNSCASFTQGELFSLQDLLKENLVLHFLTTAHVSTFMH